MIVQPKQVKSPGSLKSTGEIFFITSVECCRCGIGFRIEDMLSEQRS